MIDFYSRRGSTSVHLRAPTGQASPARVVFNIASVEWIAQATERLRRLNGNARAKAKQRLPAVTWSMAGALSRNREALGMGTCQHTRLVALDLDHLSDHGLTPLDIAGQAVCAADDIGLRVGFTSPGGDGYKLVVEIDHAPRSPEAHEHAFDYVANHVANRLKLPPSVVDRTGQDASRLCFIPHDPDVLHEEVTCPLEVPPAPPPAPPRPRPRVNARQFEDILATRTPLEWWARWRMLPVEPKPTGDDEVLVRCPDPHHGDRHPSCSLNTRTGAWHCWSCCSRGGLVHVYALATGRLALTKPQLAACFEAIRADEAGPAEAA